MQRRIALAALALLLVTAQLPTASAARGPVPAIVGLDTGPDYTTGRLPSIHGRFRSNRAVAPSALPRVGDRREWLGVDGNSAYPKEFVLRGLGEHIEVWVADDADDTSTGLRFPEGDCRNDERVAITGNQIRYFIREFDRKIYPKGTQYFSRPPDRNGSKALLYDPGVTAPNPPSPKDSFRGKGDRIVTLIDNVRDDNFHDMDNSANHPYVLGFFASGLNELFDRNVMTIDAYDWIHRTRANPPHEPAPGDNCASAAARPYLYEGTFAHEYQHLLEYYRDADETTWLNEGLADLAQTVTGYVDPSIPVTDIGFDGHIQAFSGWLELQTDANPIPRAGGPENSLNLWDEAEPQQPGEVLSDYGATYTFLELLHHRYGRAFIKKLHRHPLNGIESLGTLLADVKPPRTARRVLHDWSAMIALDGAIDDGAALTGGPAGAFKTRSMHSSVNWDNDDTYSYPGAPPNGSDFVRLRDGDGNYLNASQIESITFDGSDGLPAKPVEWVVEEDPPGHSNDEALASGSVLNGDRGIVAEVTVPQQNSTLTFETRFEIEESFDFGFVQVSTDGGRSYRSLSNTATTDDADPSAQERMFDNLPGLTGSSDWIELSFDLSQYAGQEVLLAFRYMTDNTVSLGGWWIDDVRVGSTTVSDGDSLRDWRTPTQVSPDPVEGFSLQLIAYNDAHTQAGHTLVPLGPGFTATLEGAALDFMPDDATTVAALVMYEESTELIQQYAHYSLDVNGVRQPGGS